MTPVPISIEVRLRARVRGYKTLMLVLWFLRWGAFLLPRRAAVGLLRWAVERVRVEYRLGRGQWEPLPFYLQLHGCDL